MNIHQHLVQYILISSPEQGCLLIYKANPSATDRKLKHQYYGADGASVSEALIEVVTPTTVNFRGGERDEGLEVKVLSIPGCLIANSLGGGRAWKAAMKSLGHLPLPTESAAGASSPHVRYPLQCHRYVSSTSSMTHDKSMLAVY